MKKNILINLLALPVWIGYFLLTFARRDLYEIPADYTVILVAVLAFTVYNMFSDKFILYNCIMGISLITGTFISGRIYLEKAYHMSDEIYAVNMFTLDVLKIWVIITVIAFLVNYIINKHKKV